MQNTQMILVQEWQKENKKQKCCNVQLDIILCKAKPHDRNNNNYNK